MTNSADFRHQYSEFPVAPCPILFSKYPTFHIQFPIVRRGDNGRLESNRTKIGWRTDPEKGIPPCRMVL